MKKWCGILGILVFSLLVGCNHSDVIETGKTEASSTDTSQVSESETNSEQETSSEIDPEIIPARSSLDNAFSLEYQADLTHDGALETIKVYNVISEWKKEVYLGVYRGQEEIYREQIYPCVSHLNRFYLVTYEGKEYLMRYHGCTANKDVDCRYEIFSLDGTGKTTTLDSLVLNVGKYEISTLNEDAWIELANKANKYLANGYLLVDIQGNEAVYSTQDNKVLYMENYAWMLDKNTSVPESIEETIRLYVSGINKYLVDNDLISNAPRFQIDLPENAKITYKLEASPSECWMITREGYIAQEKFPYEGNPYNTDVSAGWVEIRKDGYSYTSSGQPLLPGFRGDFSNYVKLDNAYLCEVEFEVYDNSTCVKFDISGDEGISYFWCLVFESARAESEWNDSVSNWVFLNQECFSREEVLRIAESYVPDFNLE